VNFVVDIGGDGDPTQKCCDGVCKPKCELGEEDESCEGSTIWCTSGCLGNPGCEDLWIHRVYLGGGKNSCSGGCPGDCHESETPKKCYTDYPCMSMEVPYTVCVDLRCELWFVTQCYYCVEDMDKPKDVNVPVWECSGE
jgi:hypothetical protein